MENEYSNGKAYKIVDNTFSKMYIGSTTQELSQRLAEHRREYKIYLNDKCVCVFFCLPLCLIFLMN